MRIIVAPDSFKGSVSALGVAEAMERGIHAVFPAAEVIKVPIADGGEGTVEALVAATAMALGTYTGGWRIVKTMGSKITKLQPLECPLGHLRRRTHRLHRDGFGLGPAPGAEGTPGPAHRQYLRYGRADEGRARCRPSAAGRGHRRQCHQ